MNVRIELAYSGLAPYLAEKDLMCVVSLHFLVPFWLRIRLWYLFGSYYSLHCCARILDNTCVLKDQCSARLKT